MKLNAVLVPLPLPPPPPPRFITHLHNISNTHTRFFLNHIECVCVFSKIFALDLPTSASAKTHVKCVLCAAYSVCTHAHSHSRCTATACTEGRERERNATNLFCDRNAMLMDIKRLYIELFPLNIDTYAPNEYQLPCDVM